LSASSGFSGSGAFGGVDQAARIAEGRRSYSSFFSFSRRGVDLPSGFSFPGAGGASCISTSGASICPSWLLTIVTPPELRVMTTWACVVAKRTRNAAAPR
jgi:hypothetical protein